MQSHRIYMDVESKHALFMAALVKMIIISDIGVFALAAIFPISYAIFGYPSPERWLMPIETQ